MHRFFISQTLLLQKTEIPHNMISFPYETILPKTD